MLYFSCSSLCDIKCPFDLIFKLPFICEIPAFFKAFQHTQMLFIVMCLFSPNDCSKISCAVLLVFKVYHKKIMDIFVEKEDIILIIEYSMISKNIYI